MPRQHFSSTIHFRAPASITGLRAPRTRHGRFRIRRALRAPLRPAPLHSYHRPWIARNPAAQRCLRDMSAAAHADDGRHPPRDFTLDRDYSASRFLVGIFLRWEHLRRRFRVPSRGVLSAAHPRHGNRELCSGIHQSRGSARQSRTGASLRLRSAFRRDRNRRESAGFLARLLRHRTFGPMRIGRGGDLDSHSLAHAGTYGLYVFDHPRRVPHGTRHRQQRRVGACSNESQSPK